MSQDVREAGSAGLAPHRQIRSKGWSFTDKTNP